MDNTQSTEGRVFVGMVDITGRLLVKEYRIKEIKGKAQFKEVKSK